MMRQARSTTLLFLAAASTAVLAGCSASAPAAPASTSASTSPAAARPTPASTGAATASAVAPTDCAATVGVELRASIESLGLALNPDWLGASGTTLSGFRDGELASAVEPALTCAWVSPRGAGDGSIVTTFARIPSGDATTVAALAAAETNLEEHRSAAAGGALAVGTTWGDNILPDGYLEKVQAYAG